MIPTPHSDDASAAALLDTEGAALDLFDVSPVSMWLEDYSEVRALFNEWRGQGVTNLREYLLADLSRVAQCSSRIRLLRVNARTLQLYGAQSFDELASQLDKVFRDDMHESFIRELEQLWNGEGRFENQTVNYSLSGQRLDILLKAVVLPGYEESWERVLVILEDITEQENARRRAHASEQYARGLFEHAPVSLWVVDYSIVCQLLGQLRQRGIIDFRTFTDVHSEFVERCHREIRVLDINQLSLSLFKAASKPHLLSNLDDVFPESTRAPFRELLIGLWEGEIFQQREMVGYSMDGATVYTHMQFWVAPGHETRWDQALIAFTDITARKKAEHYLEYLGQHDVLTGLKNRAFFTDEVERLRRKGTYPITAIVLDLNNLKQVNDEMGHAAGDALLRRVGEVISKAIDKNVQAARTGGDEFIILMAGAPESEGYKLMENISNLVEINNQYYTKVPLSLSMGVASCTASDGLDDMIRRADLAMYEQKRAFHETKRAADRRMNSRRLTGE